MNSHLYRHGFSVECMHDLVFCLLTGVMCLGKPKGVRDSAMVSKFYGRGRCGRGKKHSEELRHLWVILVLPSDSSSSMGDHINNRLARKSEGKQQPSECKSVNTSENVLLGLGNRDGVNLHQFRSGGVSL